MSSPESDIEEKFEDLQISEDGKVLNILLLGETGVGKSTFINSVANYITYKYIDIAEKNDLIVLVPSKFTIKDKNKQEHKIQIGRADDANEYLETGESATQSVKTYLFPVWKGTYKVRIIDTPGLGDTRGIQYDDNNYNNVLKYVGKLDNLHGICFLMKPTEARRTSFFEYCFSQLLCRLDKPACKKIFFVFTKTRGTNYNANETLDVLQAIFTEIKKYTPDVHIPLQLNKNVFCFDNEGFRYLAARQQKIHFSDEDKNNYKISWKTSSTNFWNLLTSIKNRDQIPYSPRIIAEITNARSVIGCFAKVMLRISDLIENNAGLKTLIENSDSHKVELEELKSREKVKATVVHKHYQSKPLLVCAASCCVDIYKVGTLTYTHHKSVCHWECEETNNADKEIVGHPQLVNCFMINAQTRQCNKCKCDFSAHLLVDYQTVLKNEDVLDEDITKQINIKESLLRSSLDVICDLQRKQFDLKQERAQIKEVCNKLASFIRQIAIIPFNHSYSEYLEQCIKKQQSSLHSDRSSLESLRVLLRENEELKSIFEDVLTDEAVSLLDSCCSFEEIKDRYKQLFNLKHNGKFVQELLSQDESLIENDQVVPEYEHIVKFNYKKDRRYKDKKKDKKKKETAGDNTNEINENYDSDVSSKSGIKEPKSKDKKKQKSEDDNKKKDKKDGDKKKDKKKKITGDKDGNENYDSDVSCKSEIKDKKSKKDKNKTDHNKDDKKPHKKMHNPSKGNNQPGNNENMAKTNKMSRSRTPPPPYSHIWTPSEGNKNFNQPLSTGFSSEEKRDNDGDSTKSTDQSYDKYEIKVSVKEKVNKPQPPNDPNTYSSSNSSAYPHYPPYGYTPGNGYDPSYPGANFPPNPRYPTPNPIHHPPNPNHPPPRYPPPSQGYGPPNPRYPPPNPSNNPGFPPYSGSFAPPYERFPPPNPGYAPPHPGFAPYYPHYAPQYDPRYPQGISGSGKSGKNFPSHSHAPRGGQHGDKRHENKKKQDGHIKKAKDAIKQGKPNKESSGGEKTRKKKHKEDDKEKKPEE